jgi:hypothetical protein
MNGIDRELLTNTSPSTTEIQLEFVGVIIVMDACSTEACWIVKVIVILFQSKISNNHLHADYMKYLKWFPLISISSISFFHLKTSLQPGKLEYFLEEHPWLVLTSYAIGLFFFLAVAASFLVFKFRKSTADKIPLLLRRPNNWAMVILLVTVFLMYFHVPAKLSFAFSSAGFQEAITMPASQPGKTIGLYKVEAIERTLSGEVFFPTKNFWASSVTSWHGFVYRPDRQDSNKNAPFRARFGAHTYTHLFGDWYIFHGTTC